MTVLVLVARVVLAAVFVVAAVTKLVDRRGTRQAVAEFGVPERLAGPAAVVLPLVELTTAVMLLPAATAALGSMLALALLATFTTAIVVALLRGRAPACHCFGQRSGAPATWRTVARNSGLGALAVVALAGSVAEPGTSAVAWIGALGAEALVAGIAACLVAGLLGAGVAALLGLLRSYGRVLVRLERIEAALAEAGVEIAGDVEPAVGLEPGTEAPWFLAVTTQGTGVSRDDLLAPGLPLLLLFTSPHCGPCAELLPEAAQWQRDHADDLTVAFACTGEADAVDAEASEFALDRVLVDESAAIAESYEATGTPAAVLVNADGTLASWVAMGRDAIVTLLAQALAPPASDGGLPIGAPAPGLELPTLDGETLSLEALRGQETVLVFWNPSCGFCRSMHDDLLAFERDADSSEPRLVVVSSGGEEETRAEGFRSTVLLDADYAAGSAFDAGGTPMAVRLDADGRIASPVAAGGEAVLELARRPVARVVVG